jgi:hypothetical protein
LGEGESQVGACVEAGQGDAHAVNREGVVVEDCVVERLDVEERGGKGGPGSLGVVEGDDEDRVGVGKGSVPGVVVRRRADGEGAPVDGQERR